jgi:hypothetical protein
MLRRRDLETKRPSRCIWRGRINDSTGSEVAAGANSTNLMVDQLKWIAL